jgi:hypothetical protein
VSRARVAVLLLVAVAAAVLLSGCTGKAACEKSGGRWVQTWNPVQRYDGYARRWAGGWDDECQQPSPTVRRIHQARTRPVQKKGGGR